MRKSTLAIAIAAAIAAPMTAQADTTLYGQAHMSLEWQDSDSGDGIDLMSNSSRIGVKGSHKLSDALSAVYQIEWGLSMDGETSDMNQRNRVAGLKGGFGTVLFGRHDTPLKTLGNAVAEDWGSTQMGGARQIRSLQDNSVGTGSGGLTWDMRLDNVIAYVSPNFGIASIFIAHSLDVLSEQDNEFVDPPGGADEVTATSVLLNLGDKKKYYLGIAWEQHELSALGAGIEDSSVFRVGGIANFGPFRLHGLYQGATDQGGVNGADRDVYGVGASFKSGPNRFKAQYYTADDLDGTNETGGDLAMIGWDHSLAKSTDVYLQYATISNDNNANFTLGGNGHGDGTADRAAGNGSDIDGFSAGLRVKF